MAKKAKSLGLPADYDEFLNSLKLRIRQSQTKAMLSVNRELVLLYWHIGWQIMKRQELDGWGKGTVDRLAKDLQNEFPGVKGFSRTNIFRMRAFCLAYRLQDPKVPRVAGQNSPSKVVPQAVGQLSGDSPPEFTLNLPWGHNGVLIEKIKDPQ